MEEQPQARTIIETLHSAGFIAYYAGGWVRDFLLQHPSDDIDIATNAPPNTLLSLFPKTIPVGIAFGIVIVVLEGKEFEVATFRKDLDYQDGRHPSHVEFTSAIEDAKRRDFTINGMFYDPFEKKVLDFVEGELDLQKKIIRAIGSPKKRFEEDRLRMIRAVRFACRFNFTIEEQTKQAIIEEAPFLFPAVSIERVFQEFSKMSENNFGKSLLLLHQFRLLPQIFPVLQSLSIEEIQKRTSFIPYFPKNTPVILKLLELFPNISSEEIETLCRYLKVPNKDLDLCLFCINGKNLLSKESSLYELAYFYASPYGSMCLEIFSVHLQDKKAFEEQQKKNRILLQPYIEKIQKKIPIIESKDLIPLGIPPGKLLGLLLKEGEKIAINQLLVHKEEILLELQKNPLWPKK
ncbi:MAG: CCA tRNA nucleotidyltransferase [Chlamydiota bacterium]